MTAVSATDRPASFAAARAWNRSESPIPPKASDPDFQKTAAFDWAGTQTGFPIHAISPMVWIVSVPNEGERLKNSLKSGEKRCDNAGRLDTGEFGIASLIMVGETLVIDAQTM